MEEAVTDERHEERLHRLRIAEIEAQVHLHEARGRVLRTALRVQKQLREWRPGLYIEYGGDVAAYDADHHNTVRIADEPWRDAGDEHQERA